MSNVLLIDFQFLTRVGIKAIVSAKSNFKLIEVLSEVDDLEQRVLKKQIDFLIVHITETSESYFQALEYLIRRTRINILVTVNPEEVSTINRLTDIGVRGIIANSCTQDELMNALSTVSNGDRYFCHLVLDVVFAKEVPIPTEQEQLLSDRENEVVTLIARGHTSHQIADQLFLSVHTINSHRKRILRKLHMKSPTELIFYAIQNGLVRTP